MNLLKYLFAAIFLFAYSYVYTQENDFGEYLYIPNDEYSFDGIVTKYFSNGESPYTLFYTGANIRGEGVFWILDTMNDNQIIILETSIRYGPRIKWHKDYIAEIFIPTGSPFYHSYYYNFLNGTLSRRINFSIYYDIANDYIVSLNDKGLNIYDLNMNEFIHNFAFDQDVPILNIFVFGNYSIKIEEDILYFNYKIEAGNIDEEGEYIFKLEKKNIA